MTRLLSALVFLLAYSVSAKAETLFEGMLQITAINAACTSPFLHAGDTIHASFHPKTVAGNLDFSALSQFWSWGARSYDLDGASFTSTFKKVTNNAIGWDAYTNLPSFIRITSQNPATITTTTPSVTLVGQIKNPLGVSGQENCVATFRMVGLLRTY